MGLAWFFRRRRAKPAAAPAPDPADELKQRLAESRAEEQPTPAPEPEPPAAELDERRRDVHERARASIEQMRGQPPEG